MSLPLLSAKLDDAAESARKLSRELAQLVQHEQDPTLHAQLHRWHRVISEFVDSADILRSTVTPSVRAALSGR
jgi:hypothetical protein